MIPSLHDWDAATYDRLAGPVQGFGRSLLDGLELRGDEAVLDAGCGSGVVTLALLERLPRGRVVALDASPGMLERARARLGNDRRVRLEEADLAEVRLEEPVDVVFSSAVFHWIADHARLFRSLHAALRPGGRLLAQCGGEGNIADVRRVLPRVQAQEPFARHLAGWEGPWNFSAPHVACERLEAAGFREAHAVTHVEVVTLDDPEHYLTHMILGAHLDRLPPELHSPFVARVAEELGGPSELRYVRLTLSAHRATIEG